MTNGLYPPVISQMDKSHDFKAQQPMLRQKHAELIAVEIERQVLEVR